MLTLKYTSLYALILVCCIVEVVLSLNDLGLIGFDRARRVVYDYGAFWPGLLQDWKPNYALQPVVMFATYAVLHGGVVHLCVNMITLWSLGRAVLDEVDHGKFLLLYFGTSLSGAAGFALLAPTLRPMVGASGSLFGLLGALVTWRYLDRVADREGRQYVVRSHFAARCPEPRVVVGDERTTCVGNPSRRFPWRLDRRVSNRQQSEDGPLTRQCSTHPE